jgi:hypothetical protein
VKTLKQQLLDKIDQQDFSRQTLIELGDICSKGLNPKRAYPRGIFDNVVIYNTRAKQGEQRFSKRLKNPLAARGSRGKVQNTALSGCRQAQVMHAEPLPRISPGFLWPIASVRSQAVKFFQGIFVGILCVEGLSRLEAEMCRLNTDALSLAADEMHLDASCRLVVKSTVLKPFRYKIRIELALDPVEQI